MEQGYTLVQVVGETAQLYLLRDGWELVPAPEEVPAPAGIYRVLAQGTLADLETGLADLDVQQVQEALVAEISYRNRRGAVKMLRQRLADLEEEQAKQLLRGRKVALDAPEAGGQQGKRQADKGERLRIVQPWEIRAT